MRDLKKTCDMCVGFLCDKRPFDFYGILSILGLKYQYHVSKYTQKRKKGVELLCVEKNKISWKVRSAYCWQDYVLS